MTATQTMNLSGMRLGKLRARHDPRTLLLADYLDAEALPPPPSHVRWTKNVKSWPMMRNDTVGDCTCAAAGHMIQQWTAFSGTEVVPSDEDVIAAYSAITGYDPVTGANDDGAVELDVLNHWRRHGVAGHRIMAYAAVEPGNLDHVKDSIELFGNCYIGLGLPRSAQHQRVWSLPPGGARNDGEPWSWGGHAVPVVGYDARGLVCVTWGTLKRMTWGFWNAYCDEAYCVLSRDWLKPNGEAPSGFDLETLQSDLRALERAG